MEAFIVKQMKRAGINQKSAVEIFNKHQDLFIRAFTHKSFNSTYNYDMLEAYGDHVINTALFDILWERYPSLGQGTITLAFQKAKSETILFREGEKEGFFDYIIMSDEYKQDAINWRDNSKKQNFTPAHENTNIYIKLLEDTVESFCGALCKAVNLWGDCKIGPGAEVVYRWAIPIINGLPFDPTNEEETKNIKQQLKEYWDTVYAKDVFEGKKMSNHLMFFKDRDSRPGRIIMRAVDPSPGTTGYKKPIAIGIGYTEDNAREEAAKLAFPIMKRDYFQKYQEGLIYKASMTL